MSATAMPHCDGEGGREAEIRQERRGALTTENYPREQKFILHGNTVQVGYDNASTAST